MPHCPQCARCPECGGRPHRAVQANYLQDREEIRLVDERIIYLQNKGNNTHEDRRQLKGLLESSIKYKRYNAFWTSRGPHDAHILFHELHEIFWEFLESFMKCLITYMFVVNFTRVSWQFLSCPQPQCIYNTHNFDFTCVRPVHLFLVPSNVVVSIDTQIVETNNSDVGRIAIGNVVSQPKHVRMGCTTYGVYHRNLITLIDSTTYYY